MGVNTLSDYAELRNSKVWIWVTNLLHFRSLFIPKIHPLLFNRKNLLGYFFYQKEMLHRRSLKKKMLNFFNLFSKGIQK